MQLKLRHIILFVFASLLLILSDLAGGALLGLAALMQVALLIQNIELSKKSQWAALKLFLISIPLFFFWGGVHSFTTIYLRESRYLFFLMAGSVSFFLSFLIVFQIVFSYFYLAKNEFNVSATLQDEFNDIKNKKADLLKSALFLFIFSFVPWLTTDWKLVFAVTATHLYLNPSQLKKAVSQF